MITLVDVLNRHAAEQPEKIAVHFRDQSLTYAQLRRQAALLGGYLQSLGVTVGDRIMLTGASRPEYLIGLLAVQMVGGITVPVDRNPKPATLSYIHQLTGAKYYLSTLKKAPEGIAILPYGDTIAAAVEHNQEAQVPETDPDRLAELLFTTGTTGRPKGASHTLRCISANMHNTFTGIGMRKEDVLLLPLPLNHSFGMRVLRACLLAGGTIVLQNGFGFARETELNIEQFHCNALACVPSSMDLMLSQMEDRAARIFGQLRYIEFGAGSLSVQRKRYLSELLPHTELFNTWGSSETGGCLFLHVNRHLDKVSAVGHPLEGIQVRLLSQADGTPLEGTGPDVVGRLALKGQMQMVGYYGLPERTAEALQDGWLVTNDLVWRDDDGFIYMLGRADDIINVGGEKASPVEIENAASECPGVVECACIGVEDTDGVLGEVPALYLVPENSSFDPAAVTKFLSPRLETYKLPKKFVFVDALPRNAMGKLDRKELRRMWADSGDLKLTNPVMENILARRSIRKFTDQPVPRRLVETLVKAGINAPSGHNLQTWRFTVLTNQAEIQRLKAVIQPVSKRCKTICYGFNNPQALILISNDRAQRRRHPGCLCAAENIQLAATSFGLGATWINALMTICDEPEIREKLDQYQIPKTHNVWAMIAVGWPEAPGKALARKTNVVHFVD